MATITTRDGANVFYKDWGAKDAQPIVFHHGWPLSADDWDSQMLFFLSQGYRVIAFDRRGHGRSDQTHTGNDMDTYASDTAELVNALDLKDAVHIGHSTGGGGVARYVARAESGRVAKAVLIGAVTPLMLQTSANPEGTPKEVFDGFRSALTANRAQFFKDIPAGPFYGFNRDGAVVSQGLIDNWWRQGMEGGAKAQYDSHRGILGDRLHRRSPGDHDSRAGDARRGRPDRSDRGLDPQGGQAPAQRHAEDLPRPVAWHVRHAPRTDQRRPARVHTGALIRGFRGLDGDIEPALLDTSV